MIFKSEYILTIESIVILNDCTRAVLSFFIVVSIKITQYNYLIVEINNQEHKWPLRLPKSDIIKSRTHFWLLAFVIYN